MDDGILLFVLSPNVSYILCVQYNILQPLRLLLLWWRFHIVYILSKIRTTITLNQFIRFLCGLWGSNGLFLSAMLNSSYRLLPLWLSTFLTIFLYTFSVLFRGLKCMAVLPFIQYKEGGGNTEKTWLYQCKAPDCKRRRGTIKLIYASYEELQNYVDSYRLEPQKCSDLLDSWPGLT